MKTGAELIDEERQRQIDEEGWTPEYDELHRPGDLALAGMCYVKSAAHDLVCGRVVTVMPNPPCGWPWDIAWWKPTTVKRDLVKAGALIAAEIDRLQRQEMSGEHDNH